MNWRIINHRKIQQILCEGRSNRGVLGSTYQGEARPPSIGVSIPFLQTGCIDVDQ